MWFGEIPIKSNGTRFALPQIFPRQSRQPYPQGPTPGAPKNNSIDWFRKAAGGNFEFPFAF